MNITDLAVQIKTLKKRFPRSRRRPQEVIEKQLLCTRGKVPGSGHRIPAGMVRKNAPIAGIVYRHASAALP